MTTNTNITFQTSQPSDDDQIVSGALEVVKDIKDHAWIAAVIALVTVALLIAKKFRKAAAPPPAKVEPKTDASEAMGLLDDSKHE